jgi:glucosamine-6-phosphate deaminase
MTEIRVFDDPDELGAALADEIIGLYEQSNGAFLLGCPGGRSLRSTYRALAGRRPDLARAAIVMMDEYVPTPPVEAHHSCRGFGLREICRPLGIPEDRLWIPDPEEPAAYDERIAAAGGIDLFLLASGASDGHVGFPPGSPPAGRTAVVRLAQSTRRDNMKTFPHFAAADEVPAEGVSVGLATITDAKRAMLVLHGADKREAAARVGSLDSFDPSWPASVIHACEDGEIWLDREAAAA